MIRAYLVYHPVQKYIRISIFYLLEFNNKPSGHRPSLQNSRFSLKKYLGRCILARVCERSIFHSEILLYSSYFLSLEDSKYFYVSATQVAN